MTHTKGGREGGKGREVGREGCSSALLLPIPHGPPSPALYVLGYPMTETWQMGDPQVPKSMDKLREDVNDWSLADDAGLLLVLEEINNRLKSQMRDVEISVTENTLLFLSLLCPSFISLCLVVSLLILALHSLLSTSSSPSSSSPLSSSPSSSSPRHRLAALPLHINHAIRLMDPPPLIDPNPHIPRPKP